MFIEQFKRSRYFRILALGVVCLFFINSHSWAVAENVITGHSQKLQVQSIFNPMVEASGRSFEEQVRVEIAFIISTLLKRPHIPFQELNASLDEWLSLVPGEERRERLLNIISNPRLQDNGELKIDIELFAGKNKGRKFTVVSSLSELEALQREGDLIHLFLRESALAGKVRVSAKVDEPLREKGDISGPSLIGPGPEEDGKEPEASSERSYFSFAPFVVSGILMQRWDLILLGLVTLGLAGLLV
ncbi:MAG: hypothetical protein GF408_07625, partial [Candidatus Omnitrophica bacterium]|nr:hypothetical protein [Candidatus Omnitrophota bacterium]